MYGRNGQLMYIELQVKSESYVPCNSNYLIL